MLSLRRVLAGIWSLQPLGAELWARSRQQGRPTAGAGALDIDVLIAAQCLTFVRAAELVVATFVPAKHWSEIFP